MSKKVLYTIFAVSWLCGSSKMVHSDTIDSIFAHARCAFYAWKGSYSHDSPLQDGQQARHLEVLHQIIKKDIKKINEKDNGVYRHFRHLDRSVPLTADFVFGYFVGRVYEQEEVPDVLVEDDHHRYDLDWGRAVYWYKQKNCNLMK